MSEEDPISRFAALFARARAVVPVNPEAMVLSTVGPDGRPSARNVLLKHFDDRGFVFYTNLESRKGRELRARPVAALTFYWSALGEQVRIEGAVETVSDAEADAYFATRDRASQVGAWASAQSELLTSRAELERRVAAEEQRFAGRSVPRPPHWTGLRVIPDRIEFWIAGADRLHDRVLYRRAAGAWIVERLYP